MMSIPQAIGRNRLYDIAQNFPKLVTMTQLAERVVKANGESRSDDF